MRHGLLVVSILCAITTAVGCGGNAEDPKTPSAKASMELTPFEELKAIPKELDAEVASLTKPIDDVQAVLDEIGAIPKKHGISAANMAAMAKASFENGKVSIEINGDIGAEVKAEIEAALQKLVTIVAQLKTTPDKIASLTKKAAEATAKVPLLATKVTTSATATVSNPFGNAEAKAKAQAELDGVKKVQEDTMKSVGDIQAKVAGIPAMATSALAKVTASFAAGN